MPTTSELLLLWDQQRPRTQQVEIGFSDLGSCRKRTGYKLAMTPHVNKTGNVQAVIGSAVHDAVAEIMAQVAQDGDLINHKVTYAGISGELDRYERATRTVIDTKTTSSRHLEHIKLHGPDHDDVWQVSGYAAGLILQGHPVERVRIEYLARDTGEEYPFEKIIDPNDIRDALEWLKLIRDTPIEHLPRDYDPDSIFCRGCPYGGLDGGICWEGHIPGKDLRTVLYVEDPDAGKWAQRLWDARQDKKAPAEAEAEAKAALSAVVHAGGVVTKCGEFYLRYNARGALTFVSEPRAAEYSP